MKTILSLLLALSILGTSYGAKNSVDELQKQTIAADSTPGTTGSQVFDQSQQVREISSLSVKEIEEITGRKLTVKEKISWWLFRKQAVNQHSKREVPDKTQNNNAVLGFVFSILGIIIFPLFAIPAFILSNKAITAEKLDPGTLTKSNYGLAKAGRVISIITGILFIIVLTLLVLLLAAWSR